MIMAMMIVCQQLEGNLVPSTGVKVSANSRNFELRTYQYTCVNRLDSERVILGRIRFKLLMVQPSNTNQSPHAALVKK